MIDARFCIFKCSYIFFNVLFTFRNIVISHSDEFSKILTDKLQGFVMMQSHFMLSNIAIDIFSIYIIFMV